ncbi:hypothetical protein B1R94_02285 [Mycolicibacterium litorale]|nr:hypothetical protein B1R94_02285 [Mycolicibacterium litorale]
MTASAPAPLVAASAPVTDPTSVFKAIGLGGRRDNWQAEAWQCYRRVGEFGAYVRWRANCCSRVKFVASEIDPVTGDPTGSIADDNTEGQIVAALVRAIAGGSLGQSELIKRTAHNLTVAGELWIAVLQRPEGEQWFAVTRKEMESGNGRDGLLIKLPDGTKHPFNPPDDGLFRVWDPDAEDATLPTSPAQANLDALREIQQATKKIRNADLSRLIGNGILAIPAEASLPSQDAPTAADKPEGSPPPGPRAKPAVELTKLIAKQALLAIEEGETSMAALLPIIIQMPGDHVDKIKHIEFADQITPVALQTRNDAIARLAMGLDMSPEQLLGLGSNSNHWSAFIMADQDVQLYVAPVMQLICHAIYTNALRNLVTKLGIDPTKYTLWYDTSRLTADPDLTDEAKDASDRGALRHAELLRFLGLPEDSGYDLTDPDGWKELARDQIAKNPDPALIRFWAPILDPIAGVEFPEPAPSLPAGNTDPADEEESGAEQGQEPKTEQQNDTDSRQSAAAAGRGISMAMELMVTRALELAGKRRVRSHDPAQALRLRDVAPQDYHRLMEPVPDGQVPKLIKGWDAGLDELAARYGLDANAVRSVVERRAREQLTAQVVDA